MPLVVVDELHKQFGETKVLRGVNLTVEEGDVVAVIGRSGSGKSTFLRILNGLETFDAGIVKIDGNRVSGLENDLRPLRLKVGMVFQQFNLFPHLTAGENIVFDPRTMATAYRSDDYYIPKPDNFDIRVTPTAPGRYELHTRFVRALPPVGTILTFKGVFTQNRHSPAIHATASSGVLVEIGRAHV